MTEMSHVTPEALKYFWSIAYVETMSWDTESVLLSNSEKLSTSSPNLFPQYWFGCFRTKVRMEKCCLLFLLFFRTKF